jgi:hypothetical protein
VKIERMRTHYRKLKEGVEKLKADNRKDLTYDSGMMGPAGEDGEETQQQQKERRNQSRRRKSTAICSFCGITGHVRTASQFCLKNPKTLAAAVEASAVGK